MYPLQLAIMPRLHNAVRSGNADVLPVSMPNPRLHDRCGLLQVNAADVDTENVEATWFFGHCRLSPLRTWGHPSIMNKGSSGNGSTPNSPYRPFCIRRSNEKFSPRRNR